MSRVSELIHWIASPLSLCTHTWCPELPAADPPPSHLKVTVHEGHSRGGSFSPPIASCTLSGDTHLSMSPRMGLKGRGWEESHYSGFSVSAYRGLLSAYTQVWAASWQKGSKTTQKKNKCTKPKDKVSDCGTPSRFLCSIVLKSSYGIWVNRDYR